MASASVFQQQPPPHPTSTTPTATASLDPEQNSSSGSPYPDASPNASSAHLDTSLHPGTTQSPSILESISKTSSPRQDAVSPSSLSSLGDVDAEGSPDLEYDAAPIVHVDQPLSDHASSSDQSPRLGKRKLTLEDEDYIRTNPELYGLRRSGRATHALRVIESSSEDESASDLDIRPAHKRRKTQTSRKVSQNPSPKPRSVRSSSSESDSYGGARARALTKKHRRLQNRAGAGSSTPSFGEIRFSTRRAAKITSYNEDESDDEFAEDPDTLTPNYWQGGADDSSPSIDAILKHRKKEDSPSRLPSKEDYEYYVKWQNKSHYHSTWQPYEELTSIRGAKKVLNYFDLVILEEYRIQNDPNLQPDEKEQWNLSQEEKADELADFTVVERVIDVRQGHEETEYLVKWKGLFYDSSTWESASLVSSLSQKEIDRYLDRTSSLPVSNKSESNLQTRSPYKPFREQPWYIKNGELREFQIQGINFLAHNWCSGNSVILADEMGLGKTVQTVAFMSWLRHERQQHGPFLVVVPLSTMPAWADTFDNWAPDTNYVIYTGGEVARTTIREKELFVDDNPRQTKFNVLLTTYEYVTKKEAWTSQLSQIKWQFLAVDEAHRLKNKDSQLYDKLMNLGAPSRLLITGTPIQNNLGELSALMSFLMPGKIVVDEDIDLSSEAASHRISELTEHIKPYIIRRTKQKVESDLPPKTEKIIRVELADPQVKLYRNIITRNYAALNQGAKGYKHSLLNIMMEVKKASNHPFLFPNHEELLLAGSDRRDDVLKTLITSSGKMMLLDQLLAKLKKDNHRVLIFSQMVRMLDIIGDYLRARGHQFQRLDGTIPAGARKLAMDHFNAPDSKDFCFLLSTRAGGLGINLMTADTVILFDSDWNPQADLQAMARAHRIGQKNPVNVYRFVSKDTIEEEILERARNKLMLEFITIQRGVTDQDTSDLNQRIKEVKRGLGDAPNDPEEIDRILRRRGEKMFVDSNNQKRLEELDIDAVLEDAQEINTEQPEGLAADGGEDFLKSFEYTDVKVELEWDEIIPADRLEEIKAEEKRKEEERALAEIIAQNAPRKRKAPASEEPNQRAAKKRVKEMVAAESSDDDESDAAINLDPKRPLVEKEIRNLIKAYEKFGHVDDRPDDVLKEAKLIGRDMDVVRATINDVIDMSKRLLKEEQDRLDNLQRDEGKLPTKKDRKAVVFDYHGVKRLNAETIVERMDEMRMLREVTNGTPDFRTFRVPGAQKPTDYTTEWGAREDGMLCIGVARHGHGSWTAIRDDPELGMSDKFFLEENQVARKEERSKADSKEQKVARKPGAVHLVRRTGYLLAVLKNIKSNGEDAAAQKTVENHHRNNKKQAIPARRLEKSSRPSSSPGPANIHKHRDSGKPRSQRHESDERRSSSHLKPADRHNSDRHPSENRDVDRQKHHRHQSDRQDSNHHSSHRASGGPRDSDRYRPSHHGSGSHTLDREKHDHRVPNGDRHHSTEERRIDTTSHNGSRRGGSHDRRVHRRERSRTPKSYPNDAEMVAFFRPITREIESLKEGKKDTGKDPAERTKILRTAITSADKHITEQSRGKGKKFEEDCWEFFAKHYWINKKMTGDKLKEYVDRFQKQPKS